MDLFDQEATNKNVSVHARHGDPNLQQFFTPFWAAEELVANALQGMGPVSVLEPSCGTGAFLAAISPDNDALGVDIDPRVVPAARANSGRRVLIGDYRTIDLQGYEYQAVIGNPPFELAIVEGFLDRAYQDLPDGGLVAMILPSHAFQTPSRVTRWMERFSLDVSIIPRTLFPGLSKPLVWAKYLKTGTRRVHGLLLFAETRDVENMNPTARQALARPGTWRETVRQALASLGGSASVAAIYDAIAPERRSTEFWREKVRQTLQRGFVPLGNGRWTLPSDQLKAA